MNYIDLEENLVDFDHYSKDFEKYDRGHTEYDKEQAGFISGGLYEIHEILVYSLTNSKENFNNLMEFFKQHCSNTYNYIQNKINNTKYSMLYEICREIDIRKEDNFIFPIDVIKTIAIYR